MFKYIAGNQNDNRLMVGTTPVELNEKLQTLMNNDFQMMIKQEVENSCYTQLFDLTVDMNEGVGHTFSFDRDYLSQHPEYDSIVGMAYQYLTENNFRVKRYDGMFSIDIYDIDTTVPVDTHYSSECSDNTICDVDVHSCVFYVRKDEGVKGDMKIYRDQPSGFFSFEERQKFTLPTKEGMMMLRTGSLTYDFDPHLGKGKELILSIHFETLDFEEQ